LAIICAQVVTAQPITFNPLTGPEQTVLKTLRDAWPFTHSNWTQPLPNACLWYGVSCENRGVYSYVTGLSLKLDKVPILPPGSAAPGIPEAIQDLPYLRVLELNNLGLTGMVPSLKDLYNLEKLDLSDNYTGLISLSISRLPSNKLSYLSIVSSLRGDFGYLYPFEELETLIVVPWAKGTGGDLPIGQLSFDSLKKLKHIDIRWTMLGFDIGNLNNSTEYLSVDSAVVRGDISAICKFVNLTYLSLSNTYITGSVPDCLERLPKLETLNISNSRVVGPLPPSIGQSYLKYIDASWTNYGGTIPEELGNAQSLEILKISSANLFGTIPASISNLGRLTTLDMSVNDLVGTIPPLPHIFDLNLQQNSLEGNLSFLPQNLAQSSIILSLNRLSGSILDRVFEARILKLSDNLKFLGPLPNGTDEFVPPQRDSPFKTSSSPPILQLPYMEELSLSGASLGGVIPQLIAPQLKILNMLNCQLWSFFEPFPDSIVELNLGNNDFAIRLPNSLPSSLQSLSLSVCGFVGDIPPTIFANSPRLQNVDLSFNSLRGQIPPFFSTLGPVSLDASFNLNLTGTLDTVGNAFIKKLRLVESGLEGTIPPGILLKGSLADLDLSSNNLQGTIPYFPPRIVELKLAHNHLSGNLPTRNFESSFLKHLDVSDNDFSASDLEFFAPALETLAMSRNQFRFNVSKAFGSYPNLQRVSADSNPVYGDILPYSVLPHLTHLTLRNTSITGQLDFRKLANMIGLSFRYLDIGSNPQLTPVSLQPPLYAVDGTGDNPTPKPPPNVHCYRVSNYPWPEEPAITPFDIIFDTPLFKYEQCECQRGSYGRAPVCLECQEGLNCQDPKNLLIDPGMFAYVHPDFFTQHLDSVGHNGHINRDIDDVRDVVFAGQPKIPLNTSQLPLYIEPCSGSERVCLGIDISPHFLGWNLSHISETLATQCKSGSEGRLCSRCQCSRDSSPCYFPNGFGCVQCPKNWKIPSRTLFWGLVSLVAIVAYVLLSLVILLVLRSKRKPVNEPWDRLSLIKRIAYRFLHFLDLAFVPILVAFTQLLSELTDWDSLFLAWFARFSKLLNGDPVGLGLWCFNPDFSHPQLALIGRQFLPIGISIIVILSTITASLIYRLWRSPESKSRLLHGQGSSSLNGASRLDSSEKVAIESDGSFDSEWVLGDNEDDEMLLKHDVALEYETTRYPATAFITSTIISVIQFFYFSSSLAAADAFFYSTQPYTGERYLKSLPWMRYSEASGLRTMSILFIILIVVGFPVSCLCIIVYFRRRLYDPKISIYFGSMVTRYRAGFVWWEFARTTQKLLIAVVIRALGNRNPHLTGTLSFIIGGFTAIQLIAKPWKRGLENSIDSICAFLLIISMITSGYLFSDRENMRWPSVAIDTVFIFAVLATGVFFALTEDTSYHLKLKAKNKDIALNTTQNGNDSLESDYSPDLNNLKGGIDDDMN
jgi:hypothetical protein